MAIKQTRRSISVRGATYQALRADCATRKITMSDHLEQLIAADFDDRGVGALAPPNVRRAPPAPAVKSAHNGKARMLEALQCEAKREFTVPELLALKGGSRAALSVMLVQLARQQLAEHGSARGRWRAGSALIAAAPAPLPRESSIRVGVPAAQQRLPMPASAPAPAPVRPAEPTRTTPSAPDPWSVWSVSALRPAPQTTAKHAKAVTVARALPGGTDDPARSGRGVGRTKVAPPAAGRGPTNVLDF